MAFDPFLYVALALGFLAGRLWPRPSPWTPKLTLVTVAVLVGLLGASLAAVPSADLLLAIPLALGFTVLVLGLTIGAYLLLARSPAPSPPPAHPSPSSRARVPISGSLVVALLVGYLVGRLVPFPSDQAIPYALYVLLALVGFDLHWDWNALRGIWRPLTAAVAAALVGGVLFAFAAGVALPVALATSLAFGWYSLSGPLVAARAGAVLGLLAFLTNFFRENLTMLFAPVLGKRLRGGGLTAMGGATAMDTTLYFVTRYGDERAASLSLASGLLLTLAASLVLPALLALPL